MLIHLTRQKRDTGRLRIIEGSDDKGVWGMGSCVSLPQLHPGTVGQTTHKNRTGESGGSSLGWQPHHRARVASIKYNFGQLKCMIHVEKLPNLLLGCQNCWGLVFFHTHVTMNVLVTWNVCISSSESQIVVDSLVDFILATGSELTGGGLCSCSYCCGGYLTSGAGM